MIDLKSYAIDGANRSITPNHHEEFKQIVVPLSLSLELRIGLTTHSMILTHPNHDSYRCIARHSTMTTDGEALVIIADGVSTCEDGLYASALACELFGNNLMKSANRRGSSKLLTPAEYTHAFKIASQGLRNYSRIESETRGAQVFYATTLSGIHYIGNVVRRFSLGDSPGYSAESSSSFRQILGMGHSISQSVLSHYLGPTKSLGKFDYDLDIFTDDDIVWSQEPVNPNHKELLGTDGLNVVPVETLISHLFSGTGDVKSATTRVMDEVLPVARDNTTAAVVAVSQQPYGTQLYQLFSRPGCFLTDFN
ncbi:MAG: hypothetical protein WC254_06160 [Candidatus Woesearchaeota archaeon]|jgi:serine/threonine protein phosphatase PrpC